MASCKECIYAPQCISRISYGMGDDWYGTPLTDMEKRCNGFKNKADFQEVKHGEWINPTPLCEYYHKGLFGTCSMCEYTTMDFEEYYYCPICGAKMDGGKNE